jgi:hypothetical protein
MIEIRIALLAKLRSVSFTEASYSLRQTAEVDATAVSNGLSQMLSVLPTEGRLGIRHARRMN